MKRPRLPFRDPRTVARDIPGVLDVLFPRLTGGLVMALNKDMIEFEGLSAVPEDIIEQSKLQKAMLFELSVVRAERMLAAQPVNWDDCLTAAVERQQRHYDARIPDALEQCDFDVAEKSAGNLVTMLRSIQSQRGGAELVSGPAIPGLGWIATGKGDFEIGNALIEVKHTSRNFGANDFRQVLMYWLLKYADTIESNGDIWSEVILLNPRRNAGLGMNFDYLLRSGSGNLNRVELLELLRSVVGRNIDNAFFPS